MRVLLVSSFVLPHSGGVEQFVDTVRRMLEGNGAAVRVLACRLPGGDDTADVVVPARYVGRSGWPLQTAGWRSVWREVRRADAVIANGARHVLPVISVLVARGQRKPALLILHGSGSGPYAGSLAFRGARGAFQRTLARLAVRVSLPVSVSRAGLAGARRLYGVEARYLPYPVRELPPAASSPSLATDEEVRIVWVGRLYPEKDPVAAVRAAEQVRHGRRARLEVYGDGMLRPQLEALAADRPWLELRGGRSWDEIQEVQARAHVCVSTSVADNVQVAVLEALCRGIPVVSTRVGDAPRYYLAPSLRRFCVDPADPRALSTAILTLCASYDDRRREFAENGSRLRAIHEGSSRILAKLVAGAGRA